MAFPDPLQVAVAESWDAECAKHNAYLKSQDEGDKEQADNSTLPPLSPASKVLGGKGGAAAKGGGKAGADKAGKAGKALSAAVALAAAAEAAAAHARSVPPPVRRSFRPFLTRLLLGHNKLSGPLPPEIGLFGSLQTLRLNDNQFTGPVIVYIYL